MKQTINLYQFRDAFKRMERTNFSYEGLELLFNYCEDCDTDMELDVIALCCEYAEDNFEDIATNYGIDLGSSDEIEDQLELVLQHLNDNTSVVGVTGDNTIVYSVF